MESIPSFSSWFMSVRKHGEAMSHAHLDVVHVEIRADKQGLATCETTASYVQWYRREGERMTSSALEERGRVWRDCSKR